MVSGGTRRIAERVWRAPCSCEDGGINVIVKLVDARGLITEAICATVGRALNLPIPKPYLIWLDPGQLSPGFPVQGCIAFGSREEPYPAIWSYTRDRDLVLSLLRQWPHVHQAAAFDTWIANADRTGKNMLIGSETSLWLIDHDDAMPSYLPPNGGCDNQLIAELRRDQSEWNLVVLNKKLGRAIEPFAGVDLAAMAVELENAGTGEEAASVVGPLVRFLNARLQHLLPLIDEQVGAKQTDAFLYAAADRTHDARDDTAGSSAAS